MLVLKELNQTEARDTTYPSSILMVGGSGIPALKLKRWLECNGCRVCQADPCSAGPTAAQQSYFDLVVFNLEGAAGDEVEVCQKLTTDPELAHLPVVVLVPPGCPLKAVGGLKRENVFCLARIDAGGGTICAETLLLQIIQCTRYMIDRYT
ncbi:MAG: hypothetical protein BroJett011_13720 [Chloroflexota bacterium]|nr:MAG: hypothetical protein BroJett011_13720 [Chloroflexota bacterium]